MSSARNPRFYHRLTFKLTVWYTCILAVAMGIGFIVLGAVMVSAIKHRSDAYLSAVAEKIRQAAKNGHLAEAAKEAVGEVELSGKNDFFYRIFRGGQVVSSSDLSAWRDLSFEDPPAVTEQSNEASFAMWTGKQAHSHVHILNASLDSNTVLQLGMNVTDNVGLIQHAHRLVGLIIGVLLCLAVLAGWAMAYRALAGVRNLTDVARGIAQGRLENRATATGGKDEVGELAVAFNTMTERLAALVASMKETNDNIAHELRSPLTRMRGHAEAALMHPVSDNAPRETAALTVEECDRLLGVINDMLDIAEAEAKAVSWPMKEIDLTAVMSDACELFEPVAADRDIELRLSCDGPAMVWGNIQQLQRAVANLIDNAVKYSPVNAVVEARISRNNDDVVVRVRNTGTGISEKDLPHIFERFYRGEGSRADTGSGLGLSLAQAIVRAHGGSLSASSHPGEFTEFVLRMSLARRSSASPGT